MIGVWCAGRQKTCFKGNGQIILGRAHMFGARLSQLIWRGRWVALGLVQRCLADFIATFSGLHQQACDFTDVLHAMSFWGSIMRYVLSPRVAQDGHTARWRTSCGVAWSPMTNIKFATTCV